jgi:ribosomal protein S18 acetylase RimI-like enzyme
VATTQSYLIDTNILIGLEDHHAVKPAYARFSKLASSYKLDVFVHEAAKDDIARDKDATRRQISLSKVEKFQLLGKVKGLTKQDLEAQFGALPKHNDVVDATLLHAVSIGVADFLVTQDQGLHYRARRVSPDLARRVLFVGDAADLIATTFAPKDVPVRHVEEVQAHTIALTDDFFDSLRQGYPEFDDWWKQKCIAQRRPCWVVYEDGSLSGLIVRKDESAEDTDAITKLPKILKICTFKVRPEKRGVKLGELLLRKALWYAHTNKYDLAYVTTYDDQDSLINLLGHYGFEHAGTKPDGELILERRFEYGTLNPQANETVYDADRKNYPRFVVGKNTRAFGVPILENYHDTLYPDLRNPVQPDIFRDLVGNETTIRPGNTIRKVYLCRAPSKLSDPGSILVFYKSKSKEPPSQAMTAIGILESVSMAKSTKELMQLTGGRSVYSEDQLKALRATDERPVKVINYLLNAYIEPPLALQDLMADGIMRGKNPPQSIFKVSHENLLKILRRTQLGFDFE